MLLLTRPDQKVVRFDVSVQEALLVYKFNPLQHLDGDHEYGF
jgi:hypothetical protein